MVGHPIVLEVVTSLNAALLNEYGARAFSEFDHYADDVIRLNVIFEGKVPDNLPSYNRVRFIEFDSSGHREFLRKFGHLHEANGLRIRFFEEGGQRRVNLVRDFRFNAVRFSFKIFSIKQVITHISSARHLAWLDADIRVLRSFGIAELSEFLPDEHQLMSYLGRTNFPKPNAYSEAGWLGFNMVHPDIQKFLEFVSNQYVSGEIFSQKEWHDSWLWDVARDNFENQGVRFKNISGVAAYLEHPFVNCGLGKYFDHLKGPERKKQGKSFERDRVLS